MNDRGLVLISRRLRSGRRADRTTQAPPNGRVSRLARDGHVPVFSGTRARNQNQVIAARGNVERLMTGMRDGAQGFPAVVRVFLHAPAVIGGIDDAAIDRHSPNLRVLRKRDLDDESRKNEVVDLILCRHAAVGGRWRPEIAGLAWRAPNLAAGIDRDAVQW